MMDTNKNISIYLSQAGPMERLASFDYCYNYFQSFREAGRINDLASSENIQISCLQIGFYLASWGMFRSSGQISKKSLKIYEPLIQEITTFDQNIWSIDVDTYSEVTARLLFDCTWMIDKALRIDNQLKPFRPSLTLITKIMLGIFGNIPAFDTYFVTAFGVNDLNQNSLGKIKSFYDTNRAQIDEQDIRTKDFHTGQLTHRRYSKAKIIDMIGFIEGDQIRKDRSRMPKRVR